jgi:hypothetical protein
LFLLATAATLAQTDTNTITITASRNVAAAPDQVVYLVGVRLPSSAGLSDAVAQLAGTGITAAELLSTEADRTTVTWSFQHAVPFTAMKDTYVMLAKLSQQLGAPNGVQVLSYSVNSLQTTPAAQSQAYERKRTGSRKLQGSMWEQSSDYRISRRSRTRQRAWEHTLAGRSSPAIHSPAIYCPFHPS